MIFSTETSETDAELISLGCKNTFFLCWVLQSKRKKGLQSNVVKWETVELRFDAEMYTNVTIEFASKVGGRLGPLLDNIAIFQQLTTLVSELNNTAMSSFHRQPLWCTHTWIAVLLVLNL
jgi:hypothetical protein